MFKSCWKISKKVLKKCWKSCHRDVKCRRNRQNVVRKQRKSRPGDEKTIKSYPGEGKTLIFHSALLVKKWCFFKKVFTIRGAMGDVNFKIVPEASVFRGDADFEGPGAQKYHFWRILRFWKIIFNNIFRKRFFSARIFPTRFFLARFVPGRVRWAFFWGVGPEKLLQWFTPWFSKTFLVTKRVAVGAVELYST